jgi:prolipoprotein diacylglyceryl transferase
MNKFIPTPSRSVLELVFFTVHFYALCILLGIAAAIWLTQRRYAHLGGQKDEIGDFAIVVVPMGIIGGRMYHVISSPGEYFGAGGSPLDALKIWEGGLGIWGAILIGALAGFVFFRVKKRSLSFSFLADAIAPALAIAQGIGRFGNWFNGELFGRPTTLPWALEIPAAKRGSGFSEFATFHPTFLYEAIWCFAIDTLMIYLPYFKRVAGSGSVFFFYVASYCLGRLAIEIIRIDEANQFLGQRINVWVAGSIFIISSTSLIMRGRANGKLL